MNYMVFNKRKCKGAYADLPISSMKKIKDDFWSIIKIKKPDLYLIYGLNKVDNPYKNYFNLLKKRLDENDNLWLPEKDYQSLYNILLSVDNAVSVNILAKAVLNSSVFVGGTMHEQASYLDLLERFCFNYPYTLFETIREFAPKWYAPFLFSSRPQYIRNIQERNIDGLRDFVPSFLVNFKEMGFVNPEEAIKEYYLNYKKNFSGDLRAIEWSVISDKINFSSFIPNWKSLDSLDLQQTNFIDSTKNVIVFIISTNDIFKFLNNKIEKNKLLADFISFANTYFILKKNDKDNLPFIEICKSNLSGLRNGNFLIEIVSSIENMSHDELKEHMNFLIRLYIEYINEKKVVYEEVGVVLKRIEDFKDKSEKKKIIEDTLNKFDCDDNLQDYTDDFKL